jgi:hypothetical protein
VSGVCFGRVWACLGVSGHIFQKKRRVWTCLGPLLGHFGITLGPHWGTFGSHFGVTLGNIEKKHCKKHMLLCVFLCFLHKQIKKNIEKSQTN